MDTQLSFIMILEALGLVLAFIALWSFMWSKRTRREKQIQAALESHLHGMLTAELEVVEKELKKAVQAATKDAAGVLRTNHEKLSQESQKLLAEFAQTLNSEMTAMLTEQHQQVSQEFNQKRTELLAELESYRQQKLAELDKHSEVLLQKVLRRKAWHAVQAADQHAIAKQALQEVIASGELTV